jgi:cobalt-zinc-cadmium resistance protein CzcA
LWVRGTLAPSTGPTEGVRLANQARVLLCSFPEATEITNLYRIYGERLESEQH